MDGSKKGLSIVAAFSAGIVFMAASLILVLSSASLESGAASGENVEMAEDAEYVDVTIQDLKSEYGLGEQVVFSVRVQGMSDSGNACNSFPPLVVVSDDSTKGEIFSNPIRAQRSLACIEPTEFDREFVFGDKGEIVPKSVGSYTVTASYAADTAIASHEDIVIEKQFIVG